MKKSIKTVNVMLFICMLVLVITAMLHHDLGKLHGVLGLLYMVLIVIHIKQHWGWVKCNLLWLGIKEK
jgi:hypothetical protein